ncbi:MAG: AAA family ATPase [Thermacetogeniaceae bacterium]
MSVLRKLIVENFQSHKYTEVDLSPGLNVIVGPSDHGKSALVRALRWLFFNEPKGADFVRAGARTCRVTVEMDDGTTITRLRTAGGRNRYVLKRPGEDEKVFEGFGSEIPHEIVEVSGIRKVVIDDKNRVELNFSGQLEGPFLLAENGAVRAKVIGQLGGVHILDWAQKSTATDLRRLRDEESQLSASIKELEEALHAYDGLPLLEKRIKELESLMCRIEEISRTIEALAEIAEQWREVDYALEGVRRVLELLSSLDGAEREIQRLEALEREYAALVSLAEDIRRVEVYLQRAEKAISDSECVSELESCLERLEALNKELQELVGVVREVDAVAKRLARCEHVIARTEMLEEGEKYLSRIDELVRLISSYNELLGAWLENRRDYQGASLAVERYQSEMERYLDEYERLLSALGKCPVCFGELTADSIKRALAEYE